MGERGKKGRNGRNYQDRNRSSERRKISLLICLCLNKFSGSETYLCSLDYFTLSDWINLENYNKQQSKWELWFLLVNHEDHYLKEYTELPLQWSR